MKGIYLRTSEVFNFRKLRPNWTPSRTSNHLWKKIVAQMIRWTLILMLKMRLKFQKKKIKTISRVPAIWPLISNPWTKWSLPASTCLTASTNLVGWRSGTEPTSRSSTTWHSSPNRRNYMTIKGQTRRSSASSPTWTTPKHTSPKPESSLSKETTYRHFTPAIAQVILN